MEITTLITGLVQTGQQTLVALGFAVTGVAVAFGYVVRKRLQSQY